MPLISMPMSCQVRRCFSPMCALTRFYKVCPPRLYPFLFRIEVLLCNVLIISLFLITTPVSFRIVTLTGARSPLYSLTHSYAQEISLSGVGGIYFFQSQQLLLRRGTKLERIFLSATAMVRALYEKSRPFRPQEIKEAQSSRTFARWRTPPAHFAIPIHGSDPTW